MKAVAAVNKNTVVVVHTTGPILLEAFADIANVKAIVWAGLPGQEAGNSLVDILYGDVSPSGKLPYTIARAAKDYGTTIQANIDNFPEGLFIDYRNLDKNGITPRYEFGFGLSMYNSVKITTFLANVLPAYTNFTYSDLAIMGSPTSGPQSGATIPGGASSLFDVVATVTAKITNVGSVTAAEVAQLYVGLPMSAPTTPIKQLRGFQKPLIKPGEIAGVKFELRRKDLSYWDVGTKKWVLPPGSFEIAVGASSRNLGLRGNLEVL